MRSLVLGGVVGGGGCKHDRRTPVKERQACLLGQLGYREGRVQRQEGLLN